MSVCLICIYCTLLEDVHTHAHTRSGCASVYIWGMLSEEIYARARFSTLVRGEKSWSWREVQEKKDCGIL